MANNIANTPGTSISPAANGAVSGKAPASRWGQKGISERFFVLDSQLTETPNAQQIILADAGILSELQHHHYGAYTITPGTGTAVKDGFGPYTFLNSYVYKAGSNTPIVSISGRSMGILQVIEYPDRTYETNSLPASVENPLTNASDYFNYPAATGNMRTWFRVPVALKITGAPGGYVAYPILQNKRVSNVIAPTFNLSGVAVSGAYNAASTANGNAAYVTTGNGAVTASPILETWKTLHTVPAARENMPIFGFSRYIYEALQPYSGSSFTYNFEPGGELLRATFQFIDGATLTGMATTNLNQIAYQYGTNKQLDVYTPYRNIHQQLLDYGRVLPQGTFAFDYYTPTRSLVNTKSTENTANVQVVAQFANTYSVPANSQVSVMTDKIFAVQNYLAK